MRAALDFLVIGAPKAGTTSLFAYLRTHPEIYMPAGKEEPFFSAYHPSVPHKTWTEYMTTVFANAPENATWGKVTPQYMSGTVLGTTNTQRLDGELSPERGIPERLYAIMPNIRLIAILREPVARAISGHRMQVVMFDERRSFDDAIAELLTPEQLVASRRFPVGNNTYVVFGEYGRILQGYYDVFASDQILIVFTEELERKPETVARRVFEHIWVDASFVPPNLGTRYFALKERRRVPWFTPRTWEASLARNSALRAGWRKLPQQNRTATLRRYWDWTHRMVMWNALHGRDTRRGLVCSPGTRRRLEEHYARDAQHLRELIGRYPPWIIKRDDTHDPSHR